MAFVIPLVQDGATYGGFCLTSNMFHAKHLWDQAQAFEHLTKGRSFLSRISFQSGGHNTQAAAHLNTSQTMLNVGFSMGIAIGAYNCVTGKLALDDANTRTKVLADLNRQKAVAGFEHLVPPLEREVKALVLTHGRLMTKFSDLVKLNNDPAADVYQKQEECNVLLNLSNTFLREAQDVQVRVKELVDKVKDLKEKYEKQQEEAQVAAVKSGLAAGMSVAVTVVSIAVTVTNPVSGAVGVGLRAGCIALNAGAAGMHAEVVRLELTNYSTCEKALKELAVWESGTRALQTKLDELILTATDAHERATKMQEEIKKALMVVREEEQKKQAALQAQVAELMAQMAAMQAGAETKVGGAI